MANFKDYYLKESAKEYKFKVKLAVNELTEEMKDCLETCLAKYDLRSLGAFKETPIQESPLDFPNVRNTKVFIADLVVGYPATVELLRKYVSEKTGISEQSVAVYNQMDPRETYTQEWLDRMCDPEWKANYKPALGTAYDEAEKPAYGKDYNDKFLKELSDLKAKREVTVIENPLSPKQKEDRSSHAAKDVGEKGGYSVLGGKK